MSVPRVLLLISIFLAAIPLAAQSSLDLNLLAVSPQTNSLANPFRDAPVDAFKFQVNTPAATKTSNPFFLVSPDSKANIARSPVRTVDIADAQGDITCLSMRTYRVKRENPQSDTTTPAGYTTCTPSKRFEIKSAVEVSGAPR
jgi:hypothetical protein